MGKRSNVIAERLEQGAQALESLANGLTAAQWQMRVKDGRKIGVVVHHVANMYPLEIQLAQGLAMGKPIAGVTWDDVHAMNAAHAKEFDGVTKEDAIKLLRKNSKDAATAIRALSDADLDNGSTISLNSDAPLTCQFMLEDHAMRHSFHHAAAIRKALN
ncbi:MAG: DinB family protein [Gemmatimonadales bacterium]